MSAIHRLLDPFCQIDDFNVLKCLQPAAKAACNGNNLLLPAPVAKFSRRFSRNFQVCNVKRGSVFACIPMTHPYHWSSLIRKKALTQAHAKLRAACNDELNMLSLVKSQINHQYIKKQAYSISHWLEQLLIGRFVNREITATEVAHPTPNGSKRKTPKKKTSIAHDQLMSASAPLRL